MRALGKVLVGLVAILATSGVRADDLTGATRLLCASIQATACVEGGDCGIDLPWNLNIPEFIEIDLDAKKLSTTAASGANRSTPITHMTRENGLIILQGFEMGRAFSFVITEETGRVAVAVATEGRAVAVFGACTPQPATAKVGGK
jgi:hypothetical protein